MANNTISQIKIGNTTYDICDAETRNTLNGLVYAYDKMDIRSGDQAMSVSANSVTTIGNLMERDPTDMPWAPYITCPSVYSILVHSRGAARFQRLWINTYSDNTTYHIFNNYITATNDIVTGISGVLSGGISAYTLLIDSTVALTGVYANISWIAFKV